MFIKQFIKENDCKIIAEVGVRGGGHARQIMETAGDVIEQFYLIDPYLPYAMLGQEHSIDKNLVNQDLAFWNKVAFSAYKSFLFFYDYRCRIVRLNSALAAGLFKNDFFDLVYIDADHSYLSVIKDVHYWLPKVKDNGIISGHDYSSGWRETVRAVDTMFGSDVQSLENSVWYVQLDKQKKSYYIKKIHDLLWDCESS